VKPKQIALMTMTELLDSDEHVGWTDFIYCADSMMFC